MKKYSLIQFVSYYIGQMEGDLFESNPPTSDTQINMLDDGDDLFGEPAAPTQQNDSNQEEQNSMMALKSDDENELFNTPDPVQVPENNEPTPISKWTQEKQAELAIQEQKENEDKNSLQAQASSYLATFLQNVDAAQSKRATHNQELDEQFIKSQEDSTVQPWEKVVNQIDFNRTDLHEKDVSKMKDLLLHLKNT